MPTPQPFLPHGGSYKNLIAYQKAECVYDVTFYFAHHYLEKSDRTIDQMVQAARSGKQNIAEGAAAGNTSKETEIKLTNVAKASLQELLVDYEDFLRVRGLKQWQPDDARLAQTKRACAAHNDSEYYRKAMPERSAETIANIAITLIHQTDWLLNKLTEKQELQSAEQGGAKEPMTKARKECRRY